MSLKGLRLNNARVCMVCVERMGSVSSRKHIFYIKQKRLNYMYIKTAVAIFAR